MRSLRPCSDSSATPSFPSQPEGKIGLPRANPRAARRDKKAFLSEPKEVEENDRIEKKRELLKKIGDTKGTFHAKMGTIKDKYIKELTEAEEIKRKWQYTE